MSIYTEERQKYEEVWNVPNYGDYSPGEKYADMFGCISECRSGQSVLDVGSGSGKGALKLVREYGLRVCMMDITPEGILPEAQHLPFIEHCIWKKFPNIHADYGYCCDVLEHIPPEYTMLSICNMLECCDYLFLNISTVEDNFGHAIGQPLHLTVQPYLWWLERLEQITEVLEARDLIISGVYYVRGRK